MDKKTLAHILFQFGLCVVGITVLYFTWIKVITQQILKRQINDVFEDIKRDLQLIDVNNAIRNRLHFTIKNKLAEYRDDTYEVDTQFREKNGRVVLEGIVCGLLILLVSCGISVYIARRNGLNEIDLMIKGLSIMITLCLILISFLYLVVMNYNIIDPNIIKKMIVDSLIEYSKNNSN